MASNIFVSAGDLSGDLHSGMLVRELLQRHPDWKVRALGGRHLREAGAEIISDTSNLGVIGFAASIATVPRQLGVRRAARAALAQQKPDIAILCDWGGFNIRYLPELKAAGIPILWYFPPRSWQKTGDGGLSIAPLCESIATPFPWSAERLNAVGGHAEWVGHPLLEIARAATDKAGQNKAALRRELGVPDGLPLVTIMAGSRPLELRYIAPHVANAVALVDRELPVHWLAVATAGRTAVLQRTFGPRVQVMEGNAALALAACDAAIVKSGTSTLEAAVVDAPQVVVYDVPALIHAQIKLTGLKRKIPFVAMPNIILGREVIPELLGVKCRGPVIAAEILSLLRDSERSDVMKSQYALVREALGEKLPYTATVRTADMVEALLARPH